jgi:uncharacterized membrane protein
MDFETAVQNIGTVIDASGILAIIVGSLFAFVIFLWRVVDRHEGIDAYRLFRQSLGRAILLGLELLVAADIVRTVAASPTLEGVAILVVVVLVRTFLSFSLELELTGRWPWQRAPT